MEINLNIWLKDHLALHTFSENDISGLVYHPKHGALCRRFLKFLIDSTLSAKKYPNVYARDDLESVKLELADKQRTLNLTINDLEKYTREIEVKESNLNFLHSKLQHLKILDSMQRTSISFNEEILNRSNVFSRHLTEDRKIKANFPKSNLNSMYTLEQLEQVDDVSMSEKEKSLLDKEIEELLDNCNLTREVVLKLINSIKKSSEQIQIPSSRPVVHLETLLALNLSSNKAVESAESELQSSEIKIEENLKIYQSICNLRLQVCELMKSYEASRAKINDETIERLRKSKQKIDAITI